MGVEKGDSKLGLAGIRRPFLGSHGYMKIHWVAEKGAPQAFKFYSGLLLLNQLLEWPACQACTWFLIFRLSILQDFASIFLGFRYGVYEVLYGFRSKC